MQWYHTPISIIQKLWDVLAPYAGFLYYFCAKKAAWCMSIYVRKSKHISREWLCHETIKCWAHEMRILSEILLLNNCHHDALIIVLSCVTPSFQMKYWTIYMYSYECKHMYYNNENLQAIIYIDKPNIVASSKCLGVAIWFHYTSHVIPILILCSPKQMLKSW